MSTLELPASIALVLVMANIALCLTVDRSLQASRSLARPTMATPVGASSCEVPSGLGATIRHGPADGGRRVRSC